MCRLRKSVRVALCICAVGAPIVLAAQPMAGNGFLFGAPHGTISVRGGFAQPSAGSDVFSFVQEHLTLGRGDFGASALSGDIAVFVTDRLALQLSVGSSGRSVPSEYRDWVDNKELPIKQSTVLRRMPMMLGLRYYLVPPGRTLGRLAWVPARFAPYVAGGAGRVWSRFRQSGDFVDYKTLAVFHSTLRSDAWSYGGYGAAGVEYAMTPKVGLVAETRYDRASARMSNDFSGFDRIDLSGVSATLGLTFRF